MQLPALDFSFTLLTPCFSGTALGKHAPHAELRIPPIRGHIRFWHRALFGAADCNRVWGSTDGQAAHGSRVALKLTGDQLTSAYEARLLPHANLNSNDPIEKRKAQSKGRALEANTQYILTIQRLPAATTDDWDHAQRALKTWLLLGGLGLRANRAAGSVWPSGDWVPNQTDALKQLLVNLGLNNWSIAIIGLNAGQSPAQLRATASDTIKDNPHRRIFGSINPRTPSPVKFKVARLGDTFCLIAVAPQKTLLEQAKDLLRNKPDPARWTTLGQWQYILP